MKVVSIDPGLRNLALAVFENGKLKDYGVYDLYDYSPSKKKRTDYSFLVYHFIKAEAKIFENVDALCIENQMKAKFKVIAHSFRCFFFNVAHKISPLSVRKKFKISKSDYKKNKAASKKYVETHIFKNKKDKYYSHKKKDDIADAILIGLYYITNKFQCQTP